VEFLTGDALLTWRYPPVNVTGARFPFKESSTRRALGYNEVAARFRLRRGSSLFLPRPPRLIAATTVGFYDCMRRSKSPFGT
jgi:hypothetical protein